MSERIYRTIDVYIQPDGIDVDVVSLQDEPYISVVIDNFIKGDPGEQGPPGESPELIWDNILGKPEFADVATSGSYNDLTDTPSPIDISGKADKVTSAISEDFAALDSNGNLIDSGYKPSDFALNTHVTSKIVVSDIENIPSEDLNRLQVGDIVVEGWDESEEPDYIHHQYYEYVVSFNVDENYEGDASRSLRLTSISYNMIQEVDYAWSNDDDQWSCYGKTSRPLYMGYVGGHVMYNGEAHLKNNALTVFRNTLSGNVTFVLDDYTNYYNPIVAKNYRWSFDTGNTVPNITWPTQIQYWKGGSAPTLAANKHYEIVVIGGYTSNNYGAFAECLSNADETVDITGKADKVTGATSGNFAGLDSNGNLTDSGHKHSDYLTSHQDISGKADKCIPSTTGNIAKLTAQGNLADGGVLAADVATVMQLEYKADRVNSATNGNLAGLDSNGNLTDSGSKASDFATAAQGALADTAYQKPSTGIPQSDLSSDVQSKLNKHFKGWYDSVSNLPANPVVGDYAYVEDNDTTYIYRCTTNGEWPATSTEEKDPADVTFAGGEEVNEVHIVNDLVTGGTNDVLSAEQGKEIGDIIYGFDSECIRIELIKTGEGQNVTTGKFISGNNGNELSNASYAYVTIDCTNIKYIRFQGMEIKSGVTSSGYCFYFADGTKSPMGWDIDTTGAVTSTVLKEYMLKVPDGAVTFKCTCKGKSLTYDNFYLYTYAKGIYGAVSELAKEVEGYDFRIDKIETCQFGESNADTPSFTSGYILANTGNTGSSTNLKKTAYIPIPEGYNKVRLTIMLKTSDTASGGAFYSDSGDYTQYYISGIVFPYDGAQSAATLIEKVYDIPNGAKYLRSTIGNDYVGEFKCVFLNSNSQTNLKELVVPWSEEKRKENSMKFVPFGVPRVHFHSAISEGSNALTTTQLYELYDALVTDNPNWFVRGTDLGTATDGVSVIRSYTLAYQLNDVHSLDDSTNVWSDYYSYRKVLLNAGTHGNERSSIWGLYYFIKDLLESTEEWALFIKSNFVIHIIPVLNPWGLDNDSRYNLGDDNTRQDINRCFGGTTCIEAELFKTFANTVKPFCFLDCHTVGQGSPKKLGYIGVRDDHPRIGMMMKLANNAIALCQDQWDEIATNLQVASKPYLVGILGAVYTGAASWVVKHITNNAFVLEGPTLETDNNYGKPAAKIHADLLSNMIPMFASLSQYQELTWNY